jgi:hypothetical protein
MCVQLENKVERDLFLKTTNENKVMTRPIWQLMFRLPMYNHCQKDEQKNGTGKENAFLRTTMMLLIIR